MPEENLNITDVSKPDPEYVLNIHVPMLWDTCNRIKKECNKSQSAGGSGMAVTADVARLKTYLHTLIVDKKWIQSRPQMDTPESHPHKYKLEPRYRSTQSESEVANMLDRLVDVYMTELVHSESSRYPSGIIQPGPRVLNLGGEAETIVPPSTGLRLDIIMEQMVAYITGPVANSTPMDFPESSPDELLTEHGEGGVEPTSK